MRRFMWEKDEIFSCIIIIKSKILQDVMTKRLFLWRLAYKNVFLILSDIASSAKINLMGTIKKSEEIFEL